MSRTKEASAIGLDVGTSRIVAARNGEQGYKYQSQLNAFVHIPHSKMTENVLKKQQISYSVENSSIVVHGDESEKFADLLNTEIRRPMTRGVLNAGEPDNLKIIQQIVASLAGKADGARKLCFTVPAAPLGAGESLTYHEASLRQILADLGHEAKSVNEGLAVVYAELEDTNYTGVGISCGGGLCNVCLSYLAVPVLSFSMPKAGDYIDASAAAMTGERANSIRITKEESFHLNGHFSDKVHQVLGVYYDEMIQSLVGGLRDALASAKSYPRMAKAIPLVLSGGTAMPHGFRERFEKFIGEADLPVTFSEVRLAADPLLTSAKGALVAALSDD